MLSLLATSRAVTVDIGLIITFGGIGVLATAIVIFMIVQIRGERQQNRERPVELRGRRI